VISRFMLRRNGPGFLAALDAVLKILERGALDCRTSQRPYLRDLIEELKIPYPPGATRSLSKVTPNNRMGPF
jgi:hypothetical protein